MPSAPKRKQPGNAIEVSWGAVGEEERVPKLLMMTDEGGVTERKRIMGEKVVRTVMVLKLQGTI